MIIVSGFDELLVPSSTSSAAAAPVLLTIQTEKVA